MCWQCSGNEKFDKATLKAIEKMRFEESDDTRQGISADIDIEFNSLNAYVYPPEIVKSFVDGCSKGQEDKNEFCSCMIEEVQKKYSLESFLGISLELSRGDVSSQSRDVFEDILSSCITRVPIEQFLPSAPASQE